MATGGKTDFDKGCDETFDLLCSGCKKKNKNVEADKFCVECYDYYCLSCVKFHDDFPALSSHKILDKGQCHIGSSVRFPVVPTEKCPQHGHKPVDMFCQQHNIVGCATCMIVHHSDCADKSYIPDFVGNHKQACNPTVIEKKLESLSENIKAIEKTFKKDQEALLSCKRLSMSRINKLRKEINQTLDVLEQKTVQDLDAKCKTLMGNLEDGLKQLKKIAVDVNNTEANFKLAAGNMSQLFVCITKANEFVSEAEKKVSATQTNNSPPNVDFSADERLLSVLRDIQTLGMISQEKTFKSSQSSPQLHTDITGQVSSDINYTILQVKNKKNYSVKMSSDKTSCTITSACTLEDGTIIISDCSNNKLKRLNKSTLAVLDCCDVPAHPIQVCSISTKEVAVSCWKEMKIQFVSVGRTLQTTRHENINFECFGLAYIDSKLYVPCDTAIHVYTVTGSELHYLRQLPYEKASFSSIRSIAITQDLAKIYAADSYKGLIVSDKTGSRIKECKSEYLKGAYGLCLHKNGSVLVCGVYSNNVLQFSPDGQLIGEVIKSTKMCQAVCCIKNCTKLFVSYSDNDEIEVYDIL